MIDKQIYTGALQNPYAQFTVTLIPQEVLPFYYDFNYFRVMTLSADTLDIRVGGSGEFSEFIGAGVGLEIPVVANQISLKNSGLVDIDVTFVLAIGKVSDDRLNISGVVSVDDNGGSLTIDNTDLVSISGNTWELRNGAFEASGYISIAAKTILSGASFASVNNATTTIVTGAANTNGVIIRRAGISVGSGEAGYITVGGNTLLKHVVVSGQGNFSSPPLENIFVPAGQAIVLNATSNAASETWMHYEVL